MSNTQEEESYCKNCNLTYKGVGGTQCPECEENFADSTENFEEKINAITEVMNGIKVIEKKLVVEVIKESNKALLTKLLAKLHTIPCSFPERESDEYDSGFQKALREVRHILKDKYLE